MNNYEQFLSLARARRSIREFSDRPVNRDDILRVIEAARWAPSNHNRQPWRFIVLVDRGQIIRLAETVRTELSQRMKSLPQVAAEYANDFVHYATFFSGAPVLIAVSHQKAVQFSAALLEGLDHSDLVSGEPLSAAMAVQNLLLAAQALGLGACVMTAPLIARDLVSRELKVPSGCEVTCLVALGYSSGGSSQPRRKSVEQITEFREYGNRSKDDGRD